MIYELIGNLELTAMAFLMLVLFAFFGLVLVVLFISLRERRHMKPVVQTENRPGELLAAMDHIQKNFRAYEKSICFLQEGNRQPPDIHAKHCIGLAILKNFGNSPALDVDAIKLSPYVVSDGPEKHVFSLNPDGTMPVLFYLPPDMLGPFNLSRLVCRYKNCLGENFRSKITLTTDSGMELKMENTTLIAMIQT